MPIRPYRTTSATRIPSASDHVTDQCLLVPRPTRAKGVDGGPHWLRACMRLDG